MQAKILVVDDEKMILSMLKLHLESKGYLVYLASSAEQALDKLTCQPDLILMDINMPGMDGLSLCEHIRESISCPILFVTARVESQDIIDGFLAGGDDYITKPFDIEELMARIQAHLRRESRSHNKLKLSFSQELVINYSGRTVKCNGEPLHFSNTEFEIITLLSREPGRVFDRETIYERIWGYDGEGDNMVVKEHIRRIRNQLAKVTDKEYITTIWGVGYQWLNLH